MKHFCLTVTIIFCSLFPEISLATKQPMDRIAAIVNNDIITESELEQETDLILWQYSADDSSANIPPRNTIKKQILNKLVLDKIQLQMANNYGINVDAISLNYTIKNIAEQNGISVDELKRDIEKGGLTFEIYRTRIKHEVIINKLQQQAIIPSINVTDSEIENFINSPLGQDQSGAEYKLGHILIEVEENPNAQLLSQKEQEANQIIESLSNGANFKEIAMKKSSGSNALKGGDLGWRSMAELPSIFANSTPTMKIGEIKGPYRSANGFHIIKLLDKKIGNSTSNTEMKVRHIMLKVDENRSNLEAKNMIFNIRRKILDGEKFSTIAEQKSDELDTSKSGGDLGWIKKSDVLPEFYSKIQDLNKGEISEPFETDLGWHLVLLEDTRTKTTSKDAIKNKANDFLRARKYHELLEVWQKRIKDESNIELKI